MERKRVRRIDLKANSHVFLLRVRAFPTLHWKECKEQIFPSACKHRTLLRSKEKSQSIGERQKSVVCAPAVPRACSFCANGFSRPRYVFWLWRERQTLECSDMRTGGVCCPPQNCSVVLEAAASSVRVPATEPARDWWVCFPS